MAGEIYQKQGTPIVWTDATGDEELGLSGLASGGTLGGSYYDRGDLSATAAPAEYEWELIIDGFDSAPTADTDVVSLHFSQSNDTTEFDGKPTSLPTDTVDTATGPTASMINNMQAAGQVTAHSATAGDRLIARGTFRFTSRYFFPVVHNQAGVVLRTASNVHKVTLTPIFSQGQ